MVTRVSSVALRVFIALTLCVSGVQAASTAISTTTIYSMRVSTYYFTITTSTSVFTSAIGGTGPPTCTTSDGQQLCVDEPIAITLVTRYGTSVFASYSTSWYPTYSTIYSNIPDAFTTAEPSRTPASASSTSGISSSSSSLGSLDSKNETTSSGETSTGMKAAIAVAVTLGVILGAILIIFCVRRRQKKQKKLAVSPQTVNTGSAMGQHELYGSEKAISYAAGGHGKVFEVQGQHLHEAPVYAPLYHEACGGDRHGAENPNVRYEMGPDRRLYELDGTGRRE